MRKRIFLLMALIASLGELNADTMASAVVTFSVNPIISVSISGNPGSLVVAGGTASTDTSTTYQVTTNMQAQNIYAMIDSTLPPGVALLLELQSPTTGTSEGPVSLTTSPQVLVSGVSTCFETDLMITYTLTASINASPATALSRIVTYTIGP